MRVARIARIALWTNPIPVTVGTVEPRQQHKGLKSQQLQGLRCRGGPSLGYQWGGAMGMRSADAYVGVPLFRETTIEVMDVGSLLAGT